MGILKFLLSIFVIWPLRILFWLFARRIIFIALVVMIAIAIPAFIFFPAFFSRDTNTDVAIEAEKPKTDKAEKTDATPKPVESIVSIRLGGKLDKHAKYQNRIIPVKVGDVFVLEYKDGLIRRNITKLPFEKDIHPVDAVCFTIPGKTGNYMPSEKGPTAIEIEEDGKIEFSPCYPDVFSNFITLRRDKDGNETGGAIEFGYSIREKHPEDFETPRQIARMNGVAGVVLPDIKVEAKYPGLDLDKMAKEKLEKMISEKERR